MSTVYSSDQQISAIDGQIGDFFGYTTALSIHGHMAFIGAPCDDIVVSDQGSVYFFLRSSDQWNLRQKLFLSDGSASDEFGSSIAISADSSTLLVGAPQKSATTTGIVHVYTNSDNTWLKQTVLSAPHSDGWFGAAVSLSEDGNIAAIGAPQYGTKAGLVHIFNRIQSSLGTAWIHQGQIASPSNNLLFGSSISLSANGTKLLIGAPGGSTAYVYKDSDGLWIQESSALGNNVSDAFGTSVTLSFVGDMALIGAPQHRSGQGSAYVYTCSDSVWSSTAHLIASNASSDAQFGTSVALGIKEDGITTAMIGAPGDNTSHIFQLTNNTWSISQEITIPGYASDPYANLGNSVALSGNGRVWLIADSGYSSDTGTVFLIHTPTSIIPAETNPVMPYLPKVLLGTMLLYLGLTGMFIVVASNEA